MSDWKTEALSRVFKSKFTGSDSIFIVKDILVKPGDMLVNNSVITLTKVTSKTEDEVVTEETSEICVKFSNELYESATLIEVTVSEGQKISSGEDVNILKYSVPATPQNIMETSVRSMSNKISDLHISPNIPAKKLSNAISTYAKNIDPERVHFLYDDTVFGSAKDGFIITDSSFASKWCNSSISLKFNDISNAILQKSEEDEADNSSKVVIHLSEGENIDIDSNNCRCSPEELLSFFEVVSKLKKDGLTKDVDGYVIVEDMAEETRLSYFEVLIWLTYQDDDLIDEKELSELQVLMTQLKTSPEMRFNIRKTLDDPSSLVLNDIITDMFGKVPTGSEQALGVSLVKDAIRIHRATSEGNAVESKGILEIAELVKVNNDQVVFIEEACIQDESILNGEISDTQVAAAAKILAAKGAAVGVPIAAIYLSGSVVGLSAAGITSGLATLGLGGVLGLSSMVTGIGAAVILGVGIYKGVQWLAGSGKREKISRREMMLQEVLKIHQLTIGNMGEDIAYISEKMIELLTNSEINKLMIERLAKQLTMFKNAILRTKCKEEQYEKDYQNEIDKRVKQ